MSVKISRGISTSTEANRVFCSVEMEQVNPDNQDHLLAYFFAFNFITRCCCSGLCILLVCINNVQPVSLQNYSGQEDAPPHIIFAFQTLPLLLLRGDANLAVVYFLRFGPYVTTVCLITTISHSYCTPGKASQKKTYGARENGVLHCTQAYFGDNRLAGIFQKRCGLSKNFCK